jgi:acyl dehydratase
VSTAPVPLRQRWFEDYRVGERFEFGDHVVTEAEIVAFARRYDPQPFHVDAQAGEASHFGGLVASGWMTCAVLMRLMCEHFVAASSMGSPGVDRVRWLEPVRPGDRLRARVEIRHVRASLSRPDRGLVTLGQELLNQHGQVVLSLEGVAMIRRRG